MPSGRPTKYSTERIASAREYLEGGYIEHGHQIPSAVGLANVLQVTSKTLYNWGNKHPTFLHILDEIQDKQHLVLLAKGLIGEFNASIAKLALGKHGYSEKTLNEHTGVDGAPIDIDTQWTVEVHEVTHD